MLVFKNCIKTIFKNKTMIVINILFLIISSFIFTILFAGTNEVQNSFERMQDSQKAEYKLVPTLNTTQLSNIKSGLSTIDEEYIKNLNEITSRYEIDYELYSYKVNKIDGITYFITYYNGSLIPNFYTEDLQDNQYLSTNQQSKYDVKLNLKSYNTNNNFMSLFDPRYSSSNLTNDNEGVVVSEIEYNNIDSPEYTSVLIDIGNSVSPKEFEDYIYSEYEYDSFTSFNESKQEVSDAISLNFTLAIIGTLLFISITVTIFYITFRNFLDNIEKEFGIQKINNISNTKIYCSFSLTYFILFFIGILIGTLIGLLNYKIMEIQFSTVFNLYISQNITSFNIIVIYIISLITMLLSIMLLSLRRKLNISALTLIYSQAKSKSGFLLRQSKRYTEKLPILYTVKTAYLFKKSSRVTIIIVSVVLSSLFINLSLNLFTNQLQGLNDLNDSYNFKYTVFNEKMFETSDLNAYLQDQMEVKFEESVYTSHSFSVLNVNGNALDDRIYLGIENGIVIPKQYSYQNNIEINDNIYIKYGKFIGEFTVSGINELNMDQNFYISDENFLELTESDKLLYSSLYCMDECTVEGNITSVDNIIDTNIANFSQILLIVIIMLVSSIIILVLSLSLVASLILEGNKYDFYVMKLLNFNNYTTLRSTYLVFLLLSICSLLISYITLPFVTEIFSIILNTSVAGFFIDTSSSLTNIIGISISIILLYYCIFWIIYLLRKNKILPS